MFLHPGSFSKRRGVSPEEEIEQDLREISELQAAFQRDLKPMLDILKRAYMWSEMFTLIGHERFDEQYDIVHEEYQAIADSLGSFFMAVGIDPATIEPDGTLAYAELSAAAALRQVPQPEMEIQTL